MTLVSHTQCSNNKLNRVCFLLVDGGCITLKHNTANKISLSLCPPLSSYLTNPLSLPLVLLLSLSVSFSLYLSPSLTLSVSLSLVARPCCFILIRETLFLGDINVSGTATIAFSGNAHAPANDKRTCDVLLRTL